MNFQEAEIKAKKLNPSTVSKALFQEIRKIEQVLINLNKDQIKDHEDSYSKALKNSNDLYTGVYQPLTVEIAKLSNPKAPKELGKPYNFLWEGDFLENFEVKISNETISLNSTGTGAGGKAAFFAGYKEIFGLTDESLQKVIDENLLPFFMEYYTNALT